MEREEVCVRTEEWGGYWRGARGRGKWGRGGEEFTSDFTTDFTTEFTTQEKEEVCVRTEEWGGTLAGC